MIREKEKDKLYLLLSDKYDMQLLDEEIEDIFNTAEIIANSKKLSAKSMMIFGRLLNMCFLAILWLVIKDNWSGYVIVCYFVFNAFMVLYSIIDHVLRHVKLNKSKKRFTIK